MSRAPRSGPSNECRATGAGGNSILHFISTLQYKHPESGLLLPSPKPTPDHRKPLYRSCLCKHVDPISGRIARKKSIFQIGDFGTKIEVEYQDIAKIFYSPPSPRPSSHHRRSGSLTSSFEFLIKINCKKGHHTDMSKKLHVEYQAQRTLS